MKKRTDFLVTAVFVLFLVGMAAVSLVLPDRSFVFRKSHRAISVRIYSSKA